MVGRTLGMAEGCLLGTSDGMRVGAVGRSVGSLVGALSGEEKREEEAREETVDGVGMMTISMDLPTMYHLPMADI